MCSRETGKRCYVKFLTNVMYVSHAMNRNASAVTDTDTDTDSFIRNRKAKVNTI